MVSVRVHAALETRLQQQVSPQLVVQSHILELSAEELRERINEELQENPALEVVEERFFIPTSTAGPAETGYDSVEALERIPALVSLKDDLRLQLANVPRKLRQICEYLIECLDERGFLDADLQNVAAALNTDLSTVHKALSILQSLEPPGIAARSLKECLLLQLDRFEPHLIPPCTREFITTCLAAENDICSPAQLADRLGLDSNQFNAITRFISANLHPWPAERFATENDVSAPCAICCPDVSIVRENDSLCVRVSQSWSHGLRVSDAYARLERLVESAGECRQDSKEDICEKVRQARLFIHFLTRREAVLCQVTEAIIESQREFFENGPRSLNPLTRKELAEHLQLHESTISRITRDKYIELPDQRLVPFDFFFDGSISPKTTLRLLVETENPHQPLTDGELAHQMQKAGFDIARRTVAKYRDALKIPPANQRKRLNGVKATAKRH